jgi:tRNA pseudouridine32 synthase/23S rRNA pseudouridine746 synthase
VSQPTGVGRYRPVHRAGGSRARRYRADVPPRPLPVRDGLNPTRLRLPEDAGLPEGGAEVTVLAHLLARWPDDAVRLREKVAAGQVLLDDGSAVTAATPYRGRAFVHLYRDPAPEVAVPFAVDVLHRDGSLVVVDKPHFLATTPRGVHVTETVLTRLRVELDLPELSPAHRLDRLTAGVLVLTTRVAVRGAYQQLFDARAVSKTYEAVAVEGPAPELPRVVRSRIVKERGHLQAREVPGAVNAETLVEAGDGPGHYRLSPRTGRTHQLRVHLAALGIPILGDPLYPVVREVAVDDWSDPLQLLARTVSFTDPLTGAPREFTSRRVLRPRA